MLSSNKKLKPKLGKKENLHTLTYHKILSSVHNYKGNYTKPPFVSALQNIFISVQKLEVI